MKYLLSEEKIKGLINGYKQDFNLWFEAYESNGGFKKELEGMIVNGLSKEEAVFILSYSADRSSWLNRELREGSTPSDSEKLFFIERLTSSLKKMPRFSSGIVYRNDNQSVISWFYTNRGKSFNIPYFLSTSKENWNNSSVVWKIKTLNQNTKSRDISNLSNAPDEKEVLFLQNSKFRIQKIIEPNVIQLVEIEEESEVDLQLVGLYHAK